MFFPLRPVGDYGSAAMGSAAVRRLDSVGCRGNCGDAAPNHPGPDVAEGVALRRECNLSVADRRTAGNAACRKQ